MSTLTIPSPSPHMHGFSREPPWHDAHSEASSRSRERIALPPIRQTFPDFDYQKSMQDVSATTSSSATSPIRNHYSGAMTPPEYVHSPAYPAYQKRRRLLTVRHYEQQLEHEQDAAKTNPGPRLYSGPHGTVPRQQSSPPIHKIGAEIWNPSVTSPRPGHGSPPFIPSPVSLESHERIDRPTLPSIFERGTSEAYRARYHPDDEYAPEMMRRPSIAGSNSPRTEGRSPAYRSANFGYSLHHPTRVQSFSVGSGVHGISIGQPVHHYDGPYSPGHYGHQIHDGFMRMGEFGVGMHGDSKQRKRRGNLPKETTDKLRAWFVGHLHHPYPSEEEKHDLMRATGLQMNQISNWFINARRRQLPTMINNARAESDAMTVRGESNLLPSTERIDYDPENKPPSDDDGSPYRDVQLVTVDRRRVSNINRGSI
ncbi:hypothetical protein GGR54DRAFT_627960 [Hypoxylon sp. NC1633]|nr:hypothetical protein GGR54DRAFT_627960 [Hypoxylon sp. NC1633]